MFCREVSRYPIGSCIDQTENFKFGKVLNINETLFILIPSLLFLKKMDKKCIFNSLLNRTRLIRESLYLLVHFSLFFNLPEKKETHYLKNSIDILNLLRMDFISENLYGK